MKRQLDALDTAHSFFDAVDASKGEHLSVSRYAPRRAVWLRQRHMGAGEIGCFASHYLLWQRCASGTEPMIVMEDDVAIDAGFPDVVALVEASIAHSGFIRLAGLNKVAEVTIRPLGGSYRLVRFLKGPAGTQCYAISPEAARKLLAKADAWIEPVDDYLDRFWTHGVQSMAILPFRIHHDVEEQSMIADARAHRQRSLVGSVGRTVSRLYASLARRLSNIRHIGLAASRSR
jgi:glycosyl transferase family 25